MSEEIRTFVAWTRVDKAGDEQVVRAMIPPGVTILLACPEGDDDELGVDVLARQTARLAKIKVRKRRFQAVADLEVCDGRVTDPAPSPSPIPEEPADA